MNVRRTKSKTNQQRSGIKWRQLREDRDTGVNIHGGRWRSRHRRGVDIELIYQR